MFKRLAMGVLVLAVAAGASADTNKDRGKAAAKSVTEAWGSGDAFAGKALSPLGTGDQMFTINGATGFGAKIGCEGSKQFMKMTLVPASTGDIASIPVSIDSDFDGSGDQNTVLNGPFAGMCDNGIVRCSAGTWNACSYYRWKVDSSGLSLDPNNSSGNPNSMQNMGACYCFNNSCGNGLLLQNAGKILDDAGGGIALAMSEYVPRFGLSSKAMVDTTSAVFYGQTSGCGTDQKPEQYFKNTGGLEARGSANRSDPNNIYNKVLASETARGHSTSDQSCTVDRSIVMKSYWNNSAVSASVSGGGSVTSCGSGCLRITMQKGRQQASCGQWTGTADVVVNNPELIISATADSISFDDWIRLRVNGYIFYNTDANWTSESARCGENGNRGSRALNIDISSYLKNAVPGSTVQLRTDLSWADVGSGTSTWTITFRQDCDIDHEVVSNSCTAQESNSECTLRDEYVDSTQTLRGYNRTGLQPVASSRSFTSDGCSRTYTRDYWQKRRTYTCSVSSSPYNGDAAENRYNSIHSSFDTTSGTFIDKQYQNGAYTTSSQKFDPLPAKDTVASCPLVCRTKKPRPGVAAGENGTVNQLNSTGVANDYTWKECTESGACPTDSGESVVAGCGCRNNFGEAAAAMQTIRQVSQDTLCQAQ